jgi:hypothetical protein
MDNKFLGGRIKSQPTAMVGITILMIAMVNFLFLGNPPLLLLSIALGTLLLAHAARLAEKQAAKIKIRIRDE